MATVVIMPGQDNPWKAASLSKLGQKGWGSGFIPARPYLVTELTKPPS